MRPQLLRLAPAKLNLALAVGKADASGGTGGGFHPICSWMVTIDLYDELLLTRLEDDRLSRYAILWHEEAKRRSDIDWSITSDLTVRAHLALEKRAGRRLPVQMKLEKRIPVGGGLGGGSADAAAMLLAVNELFDLGLPLEDLAEAGGEVGSDVPFFIYGGSAIVRGHGQSITRHEQPPAIHAAVVFPDVQCATGRVYRLFDELHAGGAAPLREDAVLRLAAGHGRRPAMRPDAMFNDLTRAAIRAAPELEGHLARIGALAERPAHITGSGSAMFVLCDDSMHAEHLAAAIEREAGLPAVAVKSVTAPVATSPTTALSAGRMQA
jgi:4-diphosphocytidyl-2-C-methyl-D-erythritol kinase